MDLWFSELHTPYVKFSIQIDKQLHSEQTEFQRIDIFESKEFGRMMVLDGYVMLTEKDEFIYHEMIVHVPMAVHPNPKRVLIIGGGDGGTARELLRYKNVESVDLVEIDERVVNISRKYLPQTACSFDDERLHCYFEDGLKFIRHCNNEYDLIIVDSTDADFRDDYLGAKLSHATVLHRVWDIVGDNKIYQFGIRSGERAEFAWGKEHVQTRRFDFVGLEDVVEKLKGKSVYFTVDLDVLDAAVFPGTGTPEAGGVSFDELRRAMNLVANKCNVVGCDMVELSPPYDQSGISTATALKLLREYLLALDYNINNK